MDSTQLPNVIEELEDLTKAGRILSKNWMRPFVGMEKVGIEKLECPWLHRAIERGTDIGKVKGLLLMQDWGSKSERLEDAVNYISDGLKDSEQLGNDRTLRNLFARKGWKVAIESGEWLVSNAVWGLRPQKNGKDSEMCGYLGAPIHKASFLIWGQLVVELSRDKENFQLVVAGEWATFKDFPGESSSERLSDYLSRWVNWASKWSGKVDSDKLRYACESAKGRVSYVRHPSTWHMNDELEKGPP